jgi:hypothetical protein
MASHNQYPHITVLAEGCSLARIAVVTITEPRPDLPEAMRIMVNAAPGSAPVGGFSCDRMGAQQLVETLQRAIADLDEALGRAEATS